MLDKLLGKKEKGIQVFNIPEKKYCTDSKKLLKMDKKQLAQVISDMQKHIGHLCQKLQLGKKQYQKSQQKIEQVTQKSRVLNQQMSRINNQHQQLQVKLTNLQNSLQIMIQQRQSALQSQIKYFQQRALSKEKIKDLNKIFIIYQNQISILDKTAAQNKQLKQKLEGLESQYKNLSQKYNEMKQKSVAIMENNQLTAGSQENQFGKQLQTNQNTSSKCSQCLKFQSIIEGKEQMITSLNRQIATEREKLLENSDKIEQLNSDLEQILGKIQLKDEELTRIKQENAQSINLINNYKKTQSKFKAIEQKYKQQVSILNTSLETMQKQLKQLKGDQHKLQSQKKQFERNRDTMTKQSESIKAALDQKQMEMENIKIKLKSYEVQLNNLSKLSLQLSQKQETIKKLKNQIQQYKIKLQQVNNSYKAFEQEYQVKLKKAQFTTNQQRIKADGLKRALNQLETKDEQNRKNLDSMYQSKILQDGKIVQMQKKLKEYKHLIQYLRKQKIQLQKTFENKLKNMQEMVINQQEEDEVKQVNSARKSPINASPRVGGEEEYEKQIIMSNKKIAVLQQQIDMLKEQNMNLRLEKQQLMQSNFEMETKLKSLSEKREEVMRQIKKMSSINLNQPNKESRERKMNASNEQSKSRQKKIAEKAYKGFDILAKLLSALYKQFITVHLSDITRKQIKQIESSINSIVRKSLDMKDIFQDYI